MMYFLPALLWMSMKEEVQEEHQEVPPGSHMIPQHSLVQLGKCLRPCGNYQRTPWSLRPWPQLAPLRGSWVKAMMLY